MRNRLTRFVTDGIEATYTYGVDNLRTSKTVNGITTGYVWNNGKLVAETDGMSIQKVHNYIIDGIAETVEADGKTFYYKDDHGDIIFSVDKNSTYRNDYWFGAFGNKLVEEMEYPNSFGYAGEYHDAETGLIYLRNRYYDPSVGRFINEDPIRDGLNWYVYCSNNPVNFVDPFGLKDVPLRNFVESLGGTVTWDANNSSATVFFGSAGSMTYKAGKSTTNPKDTSSSLNPYLRWASDGNLKMYIDDNQLKSDFGIKDSIERYSDLFNDTIRFVLFEDNGTYYQRFTIEKKQFDYHEVNYKNFDYYLHTGTKCRYFIGYSKATAQDMKRVNNEWKDLAKDAIDVLGSDPSFSIKTNFIFSIFSIPASDFLSSDNILDSNDNVVRFRNKNYYIDAETYTLIGYDR